MAVPPIRALALVAALVLAPCSGVAAPLAPEQCTTLTAEIEAMDKAGIKAILEKGPAAARGTLTREQRDKIRTYLDFLGQLRFRCPDAAPFVSLKQEPAEDPAEAGSATAPIEAGSAGITLPPGVAAAVVAPVVPKKPADAKAPPQAKAPPKAKPAAAKAPTPKATDTPGEKTATPAAVASPAAPPPAAMKPAAKVAAPKPKSDDAYRPPAAAAEPKSQ